MPLSASVFDKWVPKTGTTFSQPTTVTNNPSTASSRHWIDNLDKLLALYKRSDWGKGTLLPSL